MRVIILTQDENLYLRLFPISVIKWGIKRLRKANHPLIIYVHPREINPDQPRLPLSFIRYFKSYVNIKSTMPKLEWLLENYKFVPMRVLVDEFYTRTPDGNK